MPASTHIEHLLLQIPGVSADEARAIAQQVAEALAQDIRPRPTPLRFEAMDMRVEIPMGTPRHRLAHEIATAILMRLP